MDVNVREIFGTNAHPAALFVRVAVGYTFLVAGSRKLMDVEGTGRGFGGMGFPAPELLAGMVGVFEVTCGTLVLVGLATRPAAIPLMVIMLMAITATKLPILVGGSVGPFAAPRGDNVGVMAFLNQARLDISMLMCAAYLFWAGAGPHSIDARIAPAYNARS